MSKTAEQKRARALQARTNWNYQECLRCVRELTQEQIEGLIVIRAGSMLAKDRSRG